MSDETKSMPAAPAYDICYWVDAADTIVNVAPGWEKFAQDNQASRLEIPYVIGRNLLSFVHGDITQMYVRTLLQSARLLRKPLVRAYRCDSPDTKRFMEMRLTVEDSGLLRWEHRTLRTENFNRRLAFTTHAANVRCKPLVRCSMCNRLKSETGWTEPETTPEVADAAAQPMPVIYGICPNCMSYPAHSGRHPTG